MTAPEMSRRLRVVGALAAIALVGAACAGADTGGTATEEPAQQNQAMQTPEEEAPSVETPSATLLRDLTDLLTGHVYLAGIAVEQAVLTKDPNSPQFKAAAQALDRNSQDLAAAIESIYGAEAADAFLKQWREHIGFFVDYTVGGLTGDRAAQKKAAKNLDRYERDFGQFLSEATGGELPADAATQALDEHVNTLVAAVDAAIAGDTSVFDKLYSAAHGHMPMVATALAGAIVAQMPEQF